MQRRLLVILLVFVAGFGVGYGITWLLVGSGSRSAERTAQRDSAQSASSAPTNAPATNATTDASAASDVAAATNATPDTTVAVTDAVAAGAGDAGPSTDKQDVKVAASDVAAPAADVAEAPKATWEACVGHACRLDFGKISGGISVRTGSLTNKQEVDWDHDFAKADKIGTLESGPDVRVEVVAVGLQNGEPAAAQIRKKMRKGEIEGVIALRIGDKKLKLVALDD